MMQQNRMAMNIQLAMSHIHPIPYSVTKKCRTQYQAWEMF